MSKILVIDDSELVANLLRDSLTEAAFEVSLAADANQGYAAALEFHPDLILLDVQLPDIAGFDLIRVIKNREELKQIPIIMITGTHHQTDHKVKAFQAGADDYVLKPFEMPELIERIRAVLRRSQRVVTPSPLMGEGRDGGGGRGMNPPPQSSRQTSGGEEVTRIGSKDTAVAPEMSVAQAATTLLLDPLHFPPQVKYPSIAMAYLITSLALSFAGLAATAGTTVKPVVTGCAVVGCWGALVAVLVMAASLLGVSLSWKEGARLASLAGLPILLKMTGALIASLWTSLSPFYYTASPALFFKSAPAGLERLDIFEIWTVLLFWILMRQRPGSSVKKAGIVTAVVWLTGIAVAAGLGKLGGS